MTAFEQAKEQRRTERAGAEQVLKHQQMRKFKREVREVILLLVNEHGVEYRLQKDGQHIFLYSGARGERPFKVAASRPVAAQMRFLVPWIREHFPHIDIETGRVKETAYGEHLFEPNDEGHCKVCGFVEDDGRAEHFQPEVFRCRSCGRPEEDCSKDPCAAVIADREATMPDEEEIEVSEAIIEPEGFEPPETLSAAQVLRLAAEPDKPGAEVLDDGWEKYVYPTAGPSEWFVVKGEHLRCTFEGCSYTREGSFAGVHLHEYTHSDKGEEMLRQGQESRKRNAALKVERAFESLEFLAKQYGFVLMTKEEADRFKNVGKVAEELAEAQAEVARLQGLLDEQQAKIDLAREAFGL